MAHLPRWLAYNATGCIHYGANQPYWGILGYPRAERHHGLYDLVRGDSLAISCWGNVVRRAMFSVPYLLSVTLCFGALDENKRL